MLNKGVKWTEYTLQNALHSDLSKTSVSVLYDLQSAGVVPIPGGETFVIYTGILCC